MSGLQPAGVIEKYREDFFMGKRMVIVVLILSMIMCSIFAVSVFADSDEDRQDVYSEENGMASSASEEETQPASAGHEGKAGTLLHFTKETEDEEAYEEGAALVMFKTTKGVSKKKAKEILQLGTASNQNLKIEAVYNFEEQQASENGSRKQVCESVCLVTSESLTTEQLIKALEKQDDVLYAEPNYRVHICSVDDPYFSKQWSMQGGAAGTPEYNEYTPNVSAVWDRGTTGSDAIVAVVDTGVNYNHPDLIGSMWRNVHQPELAGEYGFDFVDGDSDPMDENGHGSHCAGIIGAQGNNGIGITGVNQNIRIMALRSLDENGSSWLSHEVAAYNYISNALDLGEPIRAINNSWGGGENSKIFAELIDIVGEKGAVSCFAAGNDANDNDVNPDYPSSIMSPYKLTVAATREDGQLANYSNYGKESVDVAAPGTDILSTVCYDSYNPTIYGNDQAGLSAEYNDYESETSVWAGAAQLTESLHLNGEAYDPESSQVQIRISDVKDGFLDSNGKALEIDVKNMQARDIICMTLPYELDKDAVMAPSFSVMGKFAGTEDECAVFGILDVPRGTSLDAGTIGNLDLDSGRYLNKDGFDRWSHLFFQTLGDNERQALLEEVRRAEESGEPLANDPLQREIVIVLYAYGDCDAKVHLDDCGLSRQDLSGTGDFGQYDFYNGTSMATPFITGSVALLAAEEEKGGAPADPALLVGKIASMTKEGSLPVATGGIFDFTKLPESLLPRIGNIRVDKSGGSITIQGTGLNPAGGLTAELGQWYEEEMQTAEIVAQTDQELVLKDNRWINNVVNIRITDTKGHIASRSFYYLVDGKQKYLTLENVWDSTSGGPMATDGRNIYSVGKYNDGAVLKLDTEELEQGAVSLCVIDPAELFDFERDPNAQYAMELSDDLVYMNGKLYTVVEYGMAEEMEPDDSASDDYWEDAEQRSKRYRIYSGDFRLVSIDTVSGMVENLGALSAELKKTTDYTMAAYNGRLYFIGGFSYESSGLTDKVKVYDPAKTENNWSDGTPLPEARAHGRALQSGDRLIYTMGWSNSVESGSDQEDYHCPANVILEGETWTLSAMEPDNNIEPFYCSGTVTRGGKQYPVFGESVSAAKDGLIYSGLQAADYGDTFLYNASADAYQDTGYQFYQELDDFRILRGIAVGDTVYGFDGYNVYSARTDSSALLSIQAEQNKGGTVTGPEKVMPGNDAVFEITADEDCVIKSIQVDSETIPVDENAEEKTVTLKNVVKNHTLKVEFDALGHDWGNPVYTWSKDYSTVTATRTCTRDKKHVETETVSTTAKVSKPATCTAKGQNTYTATFKDAGFAKQTKTVTNIPATGKHNYKKTTDRATLAKNGSIAEKCTECGDVKSKTVIYRPKSFKLSADTYVYNGKEKKPAVTVTDVNGKKIAASNYKVSYKNNKNVGKATVTVTFKDSSNYEGTKSLSFTINPKPTTLSKVTVASKGFTAKWKKQTTQTTGYQIQYSTDKNFKSGNKTVTVKGNKTTSKKISKLKSGKTYYVRVRTYKTVSGKKYYSSWSKAKTVKTR